MHLASFAVLTSALLLALVCFSAPHVVARSVLSNRPLDDRRAHASSANVSMDLFRELEELARVVDISYCVGTTGIQPPFACLGRCGDFDGFELVTTWNTGPLLSDSCGYVALDHGGRGRPGRIIAAFRGTYSLANTVADLSTVPQEYVPYPAEPGVPDDSESEHRGWFDRLKPSRWWRLKRPSHARGSPPRHFDDDAKPACENCTVHLGFYTSYTNTRPILLPTIHGLVESYPTYELHLVGHSLGGAVALLTALEYDWRGWQPIVTTFGEPRAGNAAFRDFVDQVFALAPVPQTTVPADPRYRRVTHVEDPVPLLPLTEWGYRAHAGEIFITKLDLAPDVADLRRCVGDEDKACSAQGDSAVGGEGVLATLRGALDEVREKVGDAFGHHHAADLARAFPADRDQVLLSAARGLDARFKLWQLLFAHRDYFWRLGLCVPSFARGPF